MMNLRVVDNLAGLRALKVHHINQVVKVKSTGDDYWFDSAATDNDDSLLFVRPTDTDTNIAGRWRLFE